MTSEEFAKCILTAIGDDDIFHRSESAEKIQKEFGCQKEAMNKLINHLVKASNIIQQQQEWIDLLMIAMGDQKEEIVEKAGLEKQAIEYYKKRLKRKD